MSALSHHSLLLLIASGMKEPTLVLAPANGAMLDIDALDANGIGGEGWEPDTVTGVRAYARDGKGAYLQVANYTTPIVFFVEAAVVYLFALTGFRCDGPLLFTIRQASGSRQVVYSEAIDQSGSDNAGGSNRIVALPYARYYVEISHQATDRNAVIAFDGIGISR